ncbi:NUDIX domain-containing protein [Zhongshania aquimaris]|uniref:NUDIX hydrolase n=1 Tax=Zhongshania aquimaris TaxID=2857107 RepID=A0ABS6VTY6_9GAMM|nr:NUDIX hydrolase [Zhongshania aquimaris]MBW2941766.1 NUDIX hydrolase [Zhongshania aquimaris]
MTTGEFSGCKLALFMDGKILVYMRDMKEGIPFPGMFDLPGGGREFDESPEQCVVRELHEEFGIKFSIERLRYKQRYDLSKPGDYGYFFVGELSLAEAENISFGDEGKYWRFMDVPEFLAHPDAILHLQERLLDYLEHSKIVE